MLEEVSGVGARSFYEGDGSGQGALVAREEVVYEVAIDHLAVPT